MIYKLPEKISKWDLYNKVLPELTEQYKHIKKGDTTAVSLVQTEQINSNAVTLFAGMLNLLQNKSQNPVYLEFAYNPRFLGFLESIDFLRQLQAKGIVEYEYDYTADLKTDMYSKNNKLYSFQPCKYFEDKLIEEKKEFRDNLAQNMLFWLKSTPFFKKETTPIKGDQMWETTLGAVAELIDNAILHSGSISYLYMQSGIKFEDNKKGYLISVADVGKGYYGALSEKIEKQPEEECILYTQSSREQFYRYAHSLGIDIEKEINFLSIMEALYYSQIQDREIDLYKLKNSLAISNANFRIHQRNKEIVFTSKQCGGCNNREDILNCLQCIWNRKDTSETSLKTYPIEMAGVHIEIEFIQEKKNV
ncbi:MAG: hypothetical protein IJZ76_11695 [Lachnospiraceae bacterium]|nr:hypothetical protein [Lachnospiraceae bacterium]